jgi:uncharacterized membrane protein
MRSMLAFLALMMVFATTGPASADSLAVENCTSRVEISENWGKETITLEYLILQVGENALRDSIFIHGTPSGITVRDAEGPLENLSIENWGAFRVIEYNLRETLGWLDRSTVTIEFTKTTSNLDGSYRYEIKYLWSTTPRRVRVTAVLPQGYEITRVEGENVDPSRIDDRWQLEWFEERDNYFFAAITFVKPLENVTPGGQEPLENVTQEGPEIPSPPVPHYLLLVISFAAFLTIAAVVIKLRPAILKLGAPPRMKRPRAFSKEDIRRLLSMLTEHEKRVIEVLLERDNLTQRALCDETRIPKATMSRVLQRLENKGIVSRVGYGASKRVLLTRWARRWRGR